MLLPRKRSLVTAVLLILFIPSSEATSIGNPIIQDVELVVKRKASVDEIPMTISSANREMYGSYDDALSEYYNNDKDAPIIDDILGEVDTSSSTSSSRSKSSPSSYKKDKEESSSSHEASGGSSTTSKTKTSTASSTGSSDYYGSGSSYGSSTSSSYSSPYKSAWEKESSSSKKKKSKHKFGGIFNRPHHEWNFHPRPIHYIFGSFFTFFFFFGGATFFTAFQVLERPQGCFATSCRRSIQCYKCAFQLCNKGITYYLWGRDERWEGFESVDTDFEDEENIPRLRAGIGRALEREHNRSMKEIPSRKMTKQSGFEMT